MIKTTAQLRKEAREAEDNRNYKDAAKLYGLAIENYPEDLKVGDFFKFDMTYLVQSKKEMESMIT